MSEYPDDDALARIRMWEFTDAQPFESFMAYIKSVGQYWPDESFGWREEPLTRTYHVSTGGWSGNESIIQSMRQNAVFWLLCWESSRRGGHFVFTLPDPSTQWAGPIPEPEEQP